MREILFRGQTRRYGEKVRMGDGTINYFLRRKTIWKTTN